MDLFLETFTVSDLLHQVEATIAPLIAKSGDTLEIVIEDDLGAMWSDQTKLRQNLFNLLSNAAKFTSSGRITLTTHRYAQRGGAWLEFAVPATGIGVTAETTARPFQAFTQAATSPPPHTGGARRG